MANKPNSFNKNSLSSAHRQYPTPIALFVYFVIWVWFSVSLFTYSKTDDAWSTTGLNNTISNWGGFIGAYVADILLFLFGMSAYWIFIFASYIWLRSFRLTRKYHKNLVQNPQQTLEPVIYLRQYLGLILILVFSSSVEWARLYRFEVLLPSNSGGILGLMLGPFLQNTLSFNYAALVCVLGIIFSVALCFRFSWTNITESIGSFILTLVDIQSAWRERKTDIALGKKAVKDREDHYYQERGKEPTLDLFDDEPPLSASPAYPPTASSKESKPSNIWGTRADRLDASDFSSTSQFPPSDDEPLDSINKTSHPSRWETLDQDLGLETDAVRQSAIFNPYSQDPATVPIISSTLDNRQLNLLNLPTPYPRQAQLPSLGLLDAPQANQESVSPETLQMTSRLIEKKLKDFGVEVKVVAAMPGPVVTRYEIEPATGVKGSQIVGLSKDLARSLSLISIRVIETIPGKNCMALELPNTRRQSIRLSEILGSQNYINGASLLTMGLGKDISGNAIVADLIKMPHVLVAGTTGSGKSVGINAMILSLLFKADAKDVRLLMIDPKMLEMSVYEGIPHLIAPVVTDMRQAANGLNWCVAEMERRYKLMSKMGVRNLAGYNTKIDAASAVGQSIANPFSLTPDMPEPLDRLPYIVVVIDELADLMMVVGKKIEELIARLAQKARAAGIHLILATQRPSVDVITGLIKANIPTRIAFQVSSKIDSRTILDQMGAEALLGMGDMLYLPSGSGFPIRVHGAFVSDDEVHRVVEDLKSRSFGPDYIEGVLDGSSETESDDDGSGGGTDGEQDPLYDKAVEVFLSSKKVSASLLQRHLNIGFNRSARIVESMEKAGLVSSISSSGKRELLVPNRNSH
jgi:S-DNA-T family DNA segregation ATPase FtsK/SpoIIIE